MKSINFYRRRLPHWQPPESSFFITYRLAGSIPNAIISQLKAKYGNQPWARDAYFEDVEEQMETKTGSQLWLHNEGIAELVLASILFNDKKYYDFWCFTLMGNHVHTVLTTLKNSPPLCKLLQNHKKFTAREANRILNRHGKFWEEESFDTLIRDANHFYNSINYCLQNPVKAGLVKNWQDWKWSYVNPVLLNGYRERI